MAYLQNILLGLSSGSGGAGGGVPSPMDISQAQQDSLTRRLAAAAAAASTSTSSSPGPGGHHPSATSPGLNLSAAHSAVVGALPSSLDDDHSLSPAFAAAAAAANILDLKEVISGNNVLISSAKSRKSTVCFLQYWAKR
ncbi:hypothetical protein TYRP_001393 [Tyrophagus putrescentiae]|nr:hypothetical protein TYRP_001393 [Tyrophagus putrescentiae]